MKTETNSIVSETRRFVNHSKVVSRLLESELFQSYQKTFQASTGLPLELYPISEEQMTACRGSVNQNRFCSLLNQGDSGCRECLVAQKCLSSGEHRGVQSIACFAGLQETAIPIMVGSVMVAQLKTGQIFHEAPAQGSFEEVAGSLAKLETGRAELEEAFMATPVIEKQRYQAMVTLLAAFSLQLTKLANQLNAEQGSEGGGLIELARDFIDEHIIDPIQLDDVAHEFDISPFHFCRKFKKATGMTMTSYISKERVNLAKEALLNTDHRITDIAFDAGFQSLSQFNRTFHKVTGMSPTQLRARSAA
jgi:AraC-like DNA-binding protein